MEYQIAGLFEKYKIPFIYEKPTAVIDSGKTKIWFPDFTLPYGIVIEYFGVGKNKDYENRTHHKLKIYKENQIPVISLYPKDITRYWKLALLSKILRKLKKQHDELEEKIIEHDLPIISKKNK